MKKLKYLLFILFMFIGINNVYAEDICYKRSGYFGIEYWWNYCSTYMSSCTSVDNSYCESNAKNNESDYGIQCTYKINDYLNYVCTANNSEANCKQEVIQTTQYMATANPTSFYLNEFADTQNGIWKCPQSLYSKSTLIDRTYTYNKFDTFQSDDSLIHKFEITNIKYGKISPVVKDDIIYCTYGNGMLKLAINKTKRTVSATSNCNGNYLYETYESAVKDLTTGCPMQVYYYTGYGNCAYNATGGLGYSALGFKQDDVKDSTGKDITDPNTGSNIDIQDPEQPKWKIDHSNDVACGTVYNIPKTLPALTTLFVNFIKILTPIVLIVLGLIDIFKAVMSSKEDEIEKEKKKFIRRLIPAALVFFVIAFAQLLFSLVGTREESNTFIRCANCFFNYGCDKNIENADLESNNNAG